MLASFLDPRYKNLISRDILSDHKTAKLQQEVIDKITQGLTQDQTQTEPAKHVPKKKPKLWSILQFDSAQTFGPGVQAPGGSVPQFPM